MKIFAAGACAVLLAAIVPARAECTGAGAPDGRIAIGVCASPGAATIHGHAGAYDFENTISGDAGGIAVTNVPFLGARAGLGSGGPFLDESELFGPTAIDSSLGNGGLTAGLTPDGTIAVLSWPNPSYFNQMDYMTVARGDARMGAAENHGAFAGLDYRKADGTRAFAWLRDWPAAQGYASDSSDALVTTFAHEGIVVTQTAVVAPSADVMSIRYTVTGADDPVFVFFENLNPANHKIPWAPGHDQYIWMANDFGAVYSSDSIVHFRPDADPGKFLNVLEGADPAAALADDLTETQQPVTSFAIASSPAPVAHQVGEDASGFVREGPAADAFYDASAHGSALSGSDAALGQVDAALAVRARNGIADVTIAAAHSADDAVATAHATAFDTVLSDEEAYWRAWLAGATIPAQSGNAPVDRRGLIAIANATARGTGSIVASIARETPYAEDWTRDGAFLNYALELAGHPEIVEKHNRFYARVQRPNGTWGTMYYADGEEGGPFLYESDQQGLAVWTLWQHYVMSRSKSYLDDVYPALERSAEFMTSYANPSSGRQGPGMEDDNLFPSDGLQGGVAQWLGLVSAVRAAHAEGDDAAAQRWQNRADALKSSLVSEYWDANGNYVPPSEGYPQHLGFRGDSGAASWVIWPAGLLDPSIPRERAMLESVASYLFDYMTSVIPSAPILSYQQKVIQALAVYVNMGLPLGGARDPAKIGDWIRFYHQVLPTPTQHFGEQIWQTSPGMWANRIDMPHVWSGALVYLDALSLERPDLVPYRPWQS